MAETRKQKKATLAPRMTQPVMIGGRRPCFHLHRTTVRSPHVEKNLPGINNNVNAEEVSSNIQARSGDDEEEATNASDSEEEEAAAEIFTEALLRSAHYVSSDHQQDEEDLMQSFMMLASEQQQEENNESTGDGTLTEIHEQSTHHYRTHQQRLADSWLRNTKITGHTDVGFLIAKLVAQRGLRGKISKRSLEDSFKITLKTVAEAQKDAGLSETAENLRKINFNTALRHFIKAGEVQLNRVGKSDVFFLLESITNNL